MKHLFIRNDDVWEVNNNLLDFCNAADIIDVTHSVIPLKVSHECARFLIDGGYDVIQHGSCHKKLLDDPEAGMSSMNEMFGDLWTKCYAPPWNAVNLNEIAALEELGFEAISASFTSVLGVHLWDLLLLPLPVSIEVKLNLLDNESIKLVKDMIVKHSQVYDIVGILVHHNNATHPDQHKMFFDTIRSIDASVLSISDLIEQYEVVNNKQSELIHDKLGKIARSLFNATIQKRTRSSRST